MERLTIRNSDGTVSQPTDLRWADALERLAAYEDTGLEPYVIATGAETIQKAFATNLELQIYRELGTHDHLRKLVQAEREGRLVVLPCKNESIYTIEEDYFNCEACEHREKAYFRSNIQRVSCDMDEHCPWFIKEHICSGFQISFDKNGNAVLSPPGEWGYEGLETFSGIDGKWHLTREEAEAALKGDRDEI